jgi:DNA-binding NarL/FixJ family response regulator
MSIRVLVVEDHPIMRVGIAAMLARYAEIKVVGLVGSGEEAVTAYSALRPDIVLLDLRLPGMSGVDVLEKIIALHAKAHVIILTTYEGDEDIHRAMKLGARGYLTKGLPPETLLAAIQQIHAGGSYIPLTVSKSLATRTAHTCLSVRESEVLQLLAEGRSNKAIAVQLGIRESTVKCHISVILTRLDAEDRTHAVVIGLKRGFVHLSHPA